MSSKLNKVAVVFSFSNKKYLYLQYFKSTSTCKTLHPRDLRVFPQCSATPPLGSDLRSVRQSAAQPDFLLSSRGDIQDAHGGTANKDIWLRAFGGRGVICGRSNVVMAEDSQFDQQHSDGLGERTDGQRERAVSDIYERRPLMHPGCCGKGQRRIKLLHRNCPDFS